MLQQEHADVNGLNYHKVIYDLTFGAAEALKELIGSDDFDEDKFIYYKSILLDGLTYFERVHRHDTF
jgi:hypothetical protein